MGDPVLRRLPPWQFRTQRRATADHGHGVDTIEGGIGRRHRGDVIGKAEIQATERDGHFAISADDIPRYRIRQIDQRIDRSADPWGDTVVVKKTSSQRDADSVDDRALQVSHGTCRDRGARAKIIPIGRGRGPAIDTDGRADRKRRRDCFTPGREEADAHASEQRRMLPDCAQSSESMGENV